MPNREFLYRILEVSFLIFEDGNDVKDREYTMVRVG